MRREVVEHHADPFGVRVVLVHEVPHALREIDACALVGDLGVRQGWLTSTKHEHVGCAVAHVFIIVPRIYAEAWSIADQQALYIAMGSPAMQARGLSVPPAAGATRSSTACG